MSDTEKYNALDFSSQNETEKFRTASDEELDEARRKYIQEFMNDTKSHLIEMLPKKDFLEEHSQGYEEVKRGSVQIPAYSSFIQDPQVIHHLSAGIKELQEKAANMLQGKLLREFQVPENFLQTTPYGIQFQVAEYLRSQGVLKEGDEVREEVKKEWESFLLSEFEEIHEMFTEEWKTLARKTAWLSKIPQTLLSQFADRMLLLGEIGKGGAGVIYKVWHLLMERKMALKIIRFKDEISRIQFHREAVALANLEHSNIVKVYFAGMGDGEGYLAVELVDGVSLNQIIRDNVRQAHVIPLFGKNDELGAFDIMIPVAEAIAHMHRLDPAMRHNDLKPSNILVNGKKVMLADFGLADTKSELEKNFFDEFEVSLNDDEDITGTPGYIAPEKISGGADSHLKSDMYGLGVTFYELLTGVLPIEAEINVMNYLRKIMAQPATPIHQNRYDIPPELCSLIMSMLEKTAEKRPSAQYVYETLQRMRLEWEYDPQMNVQIEVQDGPGTNKMKTHQQAARIVRAEYETSRGGNGK